MTNEEMWADALLLVMWIGGIIWMTYKRKDDDEQTANMRAWGRYIVTATLVAAIIMGGYALWKSSP